MFDNDITNAPIPSPWTLPQYMYLVQQSNTHCFQLHLVSGPRLREANVSWRQREILVFLGYRSQTFYLLNAALFLLISILSGGLWGNDRGCSQPSWLAPGRRQEEWRDCVVCTPLGCHPLCVMGEKGGGGRGTHTGPSIDLCHSSCPTAHCAASTQH